MYDLNGKVAIITGGASECFIKGQAERVDLRLRVDLAQEYDAVSFVGFAFGFGDLSQKQYEVQSLARLERFSQSS